MELRDKAVSANLIEKSRSNPWPAVRSRCAPNNRFLPTMTVLRKIPVEKFAQHGKSRGIIQKWLSTSQ
jgi:hypothetical protein